jgi:hypothetical protein
MMVWTSRILIGVLDGDWQDLGSEVGQKCKPIFDNIQIWQNVNVHWGDLPSSPQPNGATFWP